MIDTSQELFDIVDENDQLLGYTKPRDVVHREMVDWHRITGVWIINAGKQVLCQQRSFLKDVHPGQWMLAFGGHLKAGETYDENVVLEIQEELGLEVNLVDLIRLGHHVSVTNKHHGELYVYHWHGDISELTFHDGEVEQVKWVTLEEFQQMIDAGLDTQKINPVLQDYLNTR